MPPTVGCEGEAGEKPRRDTKEETQNQASQKLRKGLSNSDFLDLQKMKNEMPKLGY